MAWNAIRSVCSDEAQKRLTVRGGHVVVDPGQQRGVAADVVALLAVAEAAAHHDVVDGLGEVDVGVALHESLAGVSRRGRPRARP